MVDYSKPLIFAHLATQQVSILLRLSEQLIVKADKTFKRKKILVFLRIQDVFQLLSCIITRSAIFACKKLTKMSYRG